jgi:hypothetical protein
LRERSLRSRTTYPPTTAQFSPPFLYSKIGGWWPDGAGVVASNRWVPSNAFQPKFAPAKRDGDVKLISSQLPCPTSAIAIRFVLRSNENRHGLRSPVA